MANDDEGLSIEETNKLRISLGLKPLNTTPSSHVSEPNGASLSSAQQEASAVDNLQKHRETVQRRKAAQDIADRIRKVRDKNERNRKLKGATLGDEDGEDTLAWIQRTRKTPSRPASQNPDITSPVLPAQVYSAAELDGLHVAHELQEFENGDNIILTLQDRGILEEGATDELVNTALLERQRLNAKLSNKKRKSLHPSYDEEEIDMETGQKKILPHYDDDDVDSGQSNKINGFAINSSSLSEVGNKSQEPASQDVRAPVNLMELPVPKTKDSDYAEPLKIKRAKKIKSLRKSRPKEIEDEQMNLVSTPKSSEDTFDGVSLVDDEDMQLELAKQRRLAARKRLTLKPEKLVDTTVTPTPMVEDPPETESFGLVLDETTEFTRGLQDITIPEARTRIKQEPLDTPHTQSMNDAAFVGDTSSSQGNEPMAGISTTGIEEEASLDKGVGAALMLLRQKGALRAEDADAEKRRAKEIWLAKDKKIRLEIELERRRVREELRESPKYRNMSARDKEALAASENRRLDALEAKASLERFKDYKPNVDIKYVDDFGRNMNQKEAFKHMSHQFHGKDSGSGKTAKKLAQIEKEKINEQKSLFS